MLATVLTRKGQTVVLDAGRKTHRPDPPAIRDLPGPVRMFHEEHLAIETDAQTPRPGAVIEIVPTYAPAAVTLHEVYHVVERGHVVDVWPVLARAGGREGAR